MHSLNNRGVDTENLRIFPNCAPNKMDYRQTMVVPNSQKLKHEEEQEEEDEDLEALRLAALKSLGAKHTLNSTQQPTLLLQQVKSRVGYPSCTVYNHQRQTKRGYYQNRLPRQNGNTYYPSRVNQNLIEIIPVEEDETLEKDVPQADSRIRKLDIQEDANIKGDSKFYRYKDNASGSEEEDTKEPNCGTMAITSISKSEQRVRVEETDIGPRKENQVEELEERRREHENINKDDRCEVTVQEEEVQEEEMQVGNEEDNEEEDVEDEDEEDDGEKATNDDDDDVLLMADLEEEDSLERLMDEMEREMNVDKHGERRKEKKEKKLAKKEVKEPKKMGSDGSKVRYRKSRGLEVNSDKNGIGALSGGAAGIGSSSLVSSRKERRSSVSPRPVDRTLQKRRSLSPKSRPRRKSPRRSPRRSPAKSSNKSFRDVPRARSPRKFSPVPRSSPRASPATSHNRSPPLRKLSPRATSPPPPPPPPSLPHSRSPRIRRSRSPPRYSRSRSPKRSNRSRSPRQIVRSRSPNPRASPIRIARLSPPRLSTPRSISPRSSSPSRKPSPRRSSPRSMRSPKLSSPAERRRLTSPSSVNRLGSPGRSPWSSPRNSPRLSPRRRKSPKESRCRKPTRARSVTPEEEPAPTSTPYKRQVSPLRKTATGSPDIVRPSKEKQKEAMATLASASSPDQSTELTNDPILEARRRKFQSTKLIDPVHDNKKIKLGKKENTSSKIRVSEQVESSDSPKSTRKTCKLIQQDYDMTESDLCLTDDYVYDVLEDVASDASSGTNTVSVCVEMVPVKVEKERTKKKKKRDKELYQVGKLKGELPLSERLGKEKKCKKRKERAASPIESSPEQQGSTVENLTVDEEADLRTELSRRRAERLNRAVPIQSARLLQSAFKGVVNEVAKTNAKAIQRHAAKGEDKNNKKEVRRVTVLHRAVTDMPDSEDEAVVDSKLPIRFRLGINKPPALEANREPKAARKSSKRPGRKVKHKNNMSMTDHERKN